MRNYKRYFAIVAVLIAVLISKSNCSPLTLNYEINSYKYSGDSVYVVFAFSFPQDAVTYRPLDNYFVSDLELDVELNNNSSHILKKWEISYSTNSVAERKDKIFIGSKQFVVQKGNYDVKIVLKDNNNINNSVYLTSQTYLQVLLEKKVKLSNIELGYSIEKLSSNQNNVNPDFAKADLYFIPNPSNEIAGVDPELKFYYEIYNYDNSKYDSMKIRYQVKNAMRTTQYNSSKIKSNLPNAFYDIGQFVLDTLPSGLYYLCIDVDLYKNSKIEDTANVEKKFYLMNPQRNPQIHTYFSEDEQYSRSEFASMSDEQCELEYKQVLVISSAGEKEVWARLNDINAKKKYLYAFWNNRRKDKTTAINSERDEYKKLIEYANTFYSIGKDNNGWKSDRGRITLKYGKPSNVDVFPAQDGNKPYEIWHYDALSGGTKFYFVDVKLNGVYQLVHSTIFEEIQNTDWQSRYLQNNK